MKKQIGSPEVLRKSHAHKSSKDYSRAKNKKDFHKQLETVAMVLLTLKLPMLLCYSKLNTVRKLLVVKMFTTALILVSQSVFMASVTSLYNTQI